MDNEIILEVGSGAGRFTEQAISTGAMVTSIDSSQAVDVNYELNGSSSNLLLVQGDIFAMPFPKDFADRLFCFGVLQHTPDPSGAFVQLVDHLKPGGHLSIDVYRRVPGLKSLFFTKYWARVISTRVPPQRLYAFCDRYTRLMWPLTGKLNKLNPALSMLLLVADYRGVYPLSNASYLDWAILDTFDMLSPKYDQPQSFDTVRRWFQEGGFRDIEIRATYGKIDARGIKLS
jgi:SAM-dependent methyltransferase